MSDVDSELAALLDEELFQEDAAVTNADNSDRPQDTQEEEDEEQQQPKRARREPLAAEDTDSDFSGADEDDDAVDAVDDEKEEIQQVTGYICPPHPGWWMGLCIRCGAARRTDDAAQEGNNANNAAAAVTTIKHLHHKQALEVSADEAARIAQGSSQRLNAQKRLMLVLDLDHTLLNTVRDIDLVGPEREAAIKQLEQQHRALQQQQQQQQPAADGLEDTQQDQQQQQQQESDGQQGVQEGIDPAAGHEHQPAPDAGATATAADADTLQSSSEPQEGQHRQQQQQQEEEDKVSKSAAAAAAAGVGQQQRPRSGSSGGSSNGNGVSCGPRAQLYYFRDKGLWTKLRPGVAAFLSAVSQLYELHIYTMGDKGYAGLMADTLDPEHRLFVGRVISSADSTRNNVKDLDVLLADESLVLILDDTEHVWENHKANLIQVERYHYFGASAKAFHREAVSPLGQGTDEPEQGGMLDNAAQLLARIHARVYGADAQQQQQQQQQQQVDVQQEQQQEQEQEQSDNALLEQQGSVPGVRRVKRPIKRLQQAAAGAAAAGGEGGGGGSDGGGVVRGHNDVRECLEAERHSVLQGCSIVFSRCWPQQQEPSAHPLWQLAVQLGASCSLTLQPGTTTHLIVAPDLEQPPGNVPFTDKVQAAQKAGIPVVHPDWLLACKFAWKQLPASAFSLKSYVSVVGSGCCTRRLLGLARSGPGGPGASAAERAAVMKAAGRTGP